MMMLSHAAREAGGGGSARGRRVLACLVQCGALLALLRPGSAAAVEIEAGRRKAEACVACHGANGNSTIPTVPSLAGQQPVYLVFQLIQFRENRRTDPQMSPFAEKLSDAEMEDLAAYYAAQKPFASRRVGDPKKVAAGRKVVEAHHCDSCHVPGLTGQKHIPRLVGQHYEYLLKELRAFKAQRRADIDGTMTTAAQPLSPQDIENVSQYIADLPPTPERRPGGQPKAGGAEGPAPGGRVRN